MKIGVTEKPMRKGIEREDIMKRESHTRAAVTSTRSMAAAHHRTTAAMALMAVHVTNTDTANTNIHAGLYYLLSISLLIVSIIILYSSGLFSILYLVLAFILVIFKYQCFNINKKKLDSNSF